MDFVSIRPHLAGFQSHTDRPGARSLGVSAPPPHYRTIVVSPRISTKQNSSHVKLTWPGILRVNSDDKCHRLPILTGKVEIDPAPSGAMRRLRFYLSNLTSRSYTRLLSTSVPLDNLGSKRSLAA